MFVLKEDGGNLSFKDSLKRYLLIMLVCCRLFPLFYGFIMIKYLLNPNIRYRGKGLLH